MLQNPPDIIMNINGSLIGGLKPINRDVTVAGGNATFYLTEDNTANGIALYTNGLKTLMLRGVEVDSAFSFGAPSLSADKKILTVPVKKSTGVNVALVNLTLLGAPVPANGSTVSAFIVGD